MKKPLHLIYIPGIGDDNPDSQRKAVSTWRWWGVEAELFQMKWSDDTPWESKLRKLLARIDGLTDQGKAVALVGASAGAGAAINAFAVRPESIIGVICIAGKVNKPEDIGDRYRRNNPSFITSAYDVPKSLASLDPKALSHIQSRYGLIDEIVPKSNSFIPGAHNRRVPSISHFLNIATQLVFGAPGFIRFLKKLNH